MFALIFGYGQKSDGSLDNQTRDRCIRGVRLYLDGKVSSIYLTVSAEKAGRSMANGMADFIQGRGIPRRNIHVIRQGGNTAGEMDVFLRNVPAMTGIFFVSSWYHIPRIVYLAMWRLSWKDFSVSTAWRYVHFKADFLVEFAKIANALIRPLSSAKILTSPLS